MLFLIIDDCPSRYDEFTRLLDKKNYRWIITFEEEIVKSLPTPSAILLDHDMPKKDGREWARELADFIPRSVPIIITSTTSLIGVREEMLNTLTEAGIRAIMNPADHSDCEKEWYWWAKGAAGV
jgi:DNA-binding response OmpR family regulator